MKNLLLLLLILSCSSLAFGQTSAEIIRSQNALKHLDLYTYPADGLTGPKTATATREYQSQNALPVSGKLDAL